MGGSGPESGFGAQCVGLGGKGTASSPLLDDRGSKRQYNVVRYITAAGICTLGIDICIHAIIMERVQSNRVSIHSAAAASIHALYIQHHGIHQGVPSSAAGVPTYQVPYMEYIYTMYTHIYI